jgi:hypothetical protein
MRKKGGRKVAQDVAGGHGQEEASLLVRVKQAAVRYRGLNADAVRKPSRQVHSSAPLPFLISLGFNCSWSSLPKFDRCRDIARQLAGEPLSNSGCDYIQMDGLVRLFFLETYYSTNTDTHTYMNTHPINICMYSIPIRAHLKD